MLEEYVGSPFRNQKGIIPHKITHSTARSVISCKSLPPRADQVLVTWVVDLNVSINSSDKSCLNNNNLAFKKLKLLLRSTYIFDRLISRTLPGITASDLLRNSEPSRRQPLHKETPSAEPGRVLNNHVTVLNLLFCLLLSIYWFFAGIFRNLVKSKSRLGICRYPWISSRLWLLIYLVVKVVI